MLPVFPSLCASHIYVHSSMLCLQVQSNALAALEAIDADMAHDIMASGCVTGDRINGLCDGVSGEWYCKFDTYHPAVNNGMPVTRVISRVVLQEILAEYAIKLGGEATITNASKVVAYHEDTCDGRPRVCHLSRSSPCCHRSQPVLVV
jgi:2-polyprenyl-6-methoxyphenol hydroxylase-like FAD-dependent oxidoreductase